MPDYFQNLLCPRPAAGDVFTRLAHRGSKPEEAVILNVIGDDTVWNAWLISGGHVNALDNGARQFTDHDWRPRDWIKPKGAPFWCAPGYDWEPKGYFLVEVAALDAESGAQTEAEKPDHTAQIEALPSAQASAAFRRAPAPAPVS